MKSAFTGIAASIIDGKMLHVIVQLSVNGNRHSAKSARRLTNFWQDKQYLIVDEKSMVACHILACLSAALSQAKKVVGMQCADLPFSRVNVILVGDFHQFAPVGGKPLYHKFDTMRANAEDVLG